MVNSEEEGNEPMVEFKGTTGRECDDGISSNRSRGAWQEGAGPWERCIGAAASMATLLLASTLVPPHCQAGLVISQGNSPTTITFDETLEGVNVGAFAGGGLSPTPVAGQLNSQAWSLQGIGGGLPFGGTAESGVLARGTSSGGVTAVGLYAFDVGDNWILGIQPGGSDFTPGSITLRVLNGTGQLVTFWDIAYDIYFFNDQNRGNRLDFSHGNSETAFTPVPELDFVTPAEREVPAEWQQVSRAIQLEQAVDPGDYLYLRWAGNDALGSGARDEYGLDNIQIAAILPQVPPPTPPDASAIPEPSSWVHFGVLALLTFAWRARRRHIRADPPRTTSPAKPGSSVATVGQTIVPRLTSGHPVSY
jgi:hypothetical protein